MLYTCSRYLGLSGIISRPNIETTKGRAHMSKKTLQLMKVDCPMSNCISKNINEEVLRCFIQTSGYMLHHDGKIIVMQYTKTRLFR